MTTSLVTPLHSLRKRKQLVPKKFLLAENGSVNLELCARKYDSHCALSNSAITADICCGGNEKVCKSDTPTLLDGVQESETESSDNVSNFTDAKPKYRLIIIHRLNRSQTGERDGQFQCSKCTKCFRTKKQLTSHMQIHKKMFRCYECEECFKHQIELRKHLKSIHNIDYVFRCKTCGKRFKQCSALNRHKRTHSGEKPFECEVCGKKFSDKRHLHRHSLIHTGNKEYYCDVCDKGFFQRSNLGIHMRSHTGEKPFECDNCGRRFTTGASLDGHLGIKNAPACIAMSLKHHEEDTQENDCMGSSSGTSQAQDGYEEANEFEGVNVEIESQEGNTEVNGFPDSMETASGLQDDIE